MPQGCIIPGCFGETNCSVFRVPKNIDRREKWLKAVRDAYPKLYVGKNFCVCEKHFQKTDFTSYIADVSGKIVHEVCSVKRKRLKQRAVPYFDTLKLDLGNDSPKMTLTEQDEPRESTSDVLKPNTHSHLEYDMENYMRYKIMGSVKKIQMKPNCVPSRFDCQADRKHQSAPNEPLLVFTKKRRTSVIEGIQDTLENEEYVEPSSSCDQGRKDTVAAQKMRLYRQRLREKKTSDESNGGTGSSLLRPRALTSSERSRLWYQRKKLLKKNSSNTTIQSSVSENNKFILPSNISAYTVNINTSDSVTNLNSATTSCRMYNEDCAINNLTSHVDETRSKDTDSSLLRQRALTSTERSKLWRQRKKLSKENSSNITIQSCTPQNNEFILPSVTSARTVIISVDKEKEVKLEHVETEKRLSDDDFDDRAGYDDSDHHDESSMDMKKEVKLECVKTEKRLSDDDFVDHAGYDDNNHHDETSVDMEKEVNLELVKIEMRHGDDDFDDHANNNDDNNYQPSVDMEKGVNLELVKIEKRYGDDDLDDNTYQSSVDMEKGVNLELVKIEKSHGDDDFSDRAGYEHNDNAYQPSMDIEKKVNLELVKIEERHGDDDLDDHANSDDNNKNYQLFVDLDKEVRLDRVKVEHFVSDDDFVARAGYDNDDHYDELDDQPLIKLAIKVPKEEPPDHLDILHYPKVAEKPKSSTITKSAPAKKSNKETVQPTPSRSKRKKMDEENKFSDEQIRKRELANARMRIYRQRKRSASKQPDSMVQNVPTADAIKKILELRQMKEIKKVKETKKRQIEEEDDQRRRELGRERTRRHREKKRLDALKSVDYMIHDSQIPGPSHAYPPFVITNQRTTFHDSQISGSGTSTNMDIPVIMHHDSENVNRIAENCAEISQVESFVRQENQEYRSLSRNEQNGSLARIDDKARASLTSNVQLNISSSTYSSYKRDSSAHMQFHREFIQNRFGYACKVCDRLWFKNDLKNLNDESMEFVRTFLSNINENTIAVCSTCRVSIQRKLIPKMAAHNGFEYPAIPDNLVNCPLDLISERFISPRIPFMQIRRLRRVHGQCEIYGQVINVPVEVNTMVEELPRNINDDHCIYVHIKRKKIHKSSYVHGLIKKENIKEWLQYLVNTPLYRTYDITIDEKFFDIEHGEEHPVDGSSGLNVGNRDDGNDDYELIEDIPIEESLIAQQQTVMWNDDLLFDLLFDKHAEELSFPSIYLGQLRQFREGVMVTPFMMASSELRRSDRRGVTPYHLLYMAMKIIRIRLRDSLTAFKHVGKKSNMTKEEIQSEDFIHNCIESNLAFLRSIPNSTWYWSENKKDLFAMIRQLGKPSIFLTISANEMGWLDLLQLLYKLNKRDHITKDAISQLHFMVKSTLINEDAVICAIYFNKLVNVIMNILQSKTCSPFRKYRVLHYFKRIEFQHRGSPQAHIFAWLNNSPNDALNDDYDKAIELIDYLTSVSASEASGNIKLQTHKHTSTCYKKITANKPQKCRFEAPFMPCKRTMILTPMKNTEEGFNNYKKRYAEIRVRLENEDFVDMNDFYNRNDIHSDEDYCNVIRAGINRPKVFVKREPSEKWHMPFNPFIFNIVQSNTDLQFITEEYSCAAYVAEYVNKTNRGLSDLQRKIIETIIEHPEFDIIDLTKTISVNILNHTEMTSQEAAWYLLREPTSKSSDIIVYIPTVWPTERQRIRKTMKELTQFHDECTDIWKENWFDKYEKRPEHLENITLAQFVSKYIVNRKGEFVDRPEPKIIRYRNYDMATDFNEYRREMVTLHIPFRNEEEEILAEMKFITIYDDHEDIILQRRKEFESNIDINKIIQICRELCHEESFIDEDEIQDVANRFPKGNPFEQLYNNPNSK